MKKLILAAMTLGLAATMYGQGSINFANNSTTLVTTNSTVGATTGTGAAVRTDFHVALYWGVLGSTEAQLIQIGNVAPGSPLNGRINAGIYTTGNATTGGNDAMFQVRGWTGNFANYDAAYAAALAGDATVLVGKSAVWQNPTGVLPAGATPNFNFGAGGFNGLVLTPVPEPSTIALAGLGAASLLLFRRRK